MSHYTCGVLIPGDTPVTQEAVEAAVAERLAPFDENTQVEPYKDYESADDIVRMAEHYKVKPTDFSILVSKMEDWSGGEGGVDEQGLYHWTRYNPQSRWDWWSIGGRWSGKLLANCEGDNLPHEDSLAANVRKVSELCPGLTLFGLITPDKEWHSSGKMGWFGLSYDEQEEDKWRAEMGEILSGHRECLLVLIDLHI